MDLMRKLSLIKRLKTLSLSAIQCQYVCNDSHIESNALRLRNKSLNLCTISAEYSVCDNNNNNNKYLKCFWPQCRYKTCRESQLIQHKNSVTRGSSSGSGSELLNL